MQHKGRKSLWAPIYRYLVATAHLDKHKPTRSRFPVVNAGDCLENSASM